MVERTSFQSYKPDPEFRVAIFGNWYIFRSLTDVTFASK